MIRLPLPRQQEALHVVHQSDYGDGCSHQGGENARCPRFASALRELTWEEKNPPASPGKFPLPPLRLDLHYSDFPESIVAETAPFPFRQRVAHPFAQSIDSQPKGCPTLSRLLCPVS
jgi:hypothetical protein